MITVVTKTSYSEPFGDNENGVPTLDYQVASVATKCYDFLVMIHESEVGPNCCSVNLLFSHYH